MPAARARTTEDVIVIGGGYAGSGGQPSADAWRLKNVDITLVNPRQKFVERIRLHQFVTGNDDAVVDYGSCSATASS